MIFRAKSKFPISSWSNRLFGEPVFIIGNGPSLLENDLSKITEYFTIGINRAYKVLLPKILMWQDESLYKDCYDDIRILPCAKITRATIDSEDVFTHFELKHGPFVFGSNPSVLHGGGSTAALAVQLGVSLGCSSLILLGCDCGYKNNMTDFYGLNKEHTSSTVPNFLAAMEWVSRECPIQVLNCGDAPCWPRVSLEEAIETSKPSSKTHLSWLSKLL